MCKCILASRSLVTIFRILKRPRLLWRTGTAGARRACSFQHRLLATVPIRTMLLVRHPAVYAILTKAFRVRQDAHAQLARIAAGEERMIFIAIGSVEYVLALVKRPLVLAIQVYGTLADCGSGWVAVRISVREIGAQLLNEVLDVRPHFCAGQYPSNSLILAFKEAHTDLKGVDKNLDTGGPALLLLREVQLL